MHISSEKINFNAISTNPKPIVTFTITFFSYIIK